MGAEHKLDLTSDVTHLLVGSITTPKYRYVAKDRPDIKVLHPEWIEAVRVSWMEGGDVDVEGLEEKHRLKPFRGLQICVTGFDNLEQRTLLSSTVESEGATYHGDLTKAVTHLIAAAPQGAKYTHAKQWGISIVSLKWFKDSLRRSMALDESLYDPAMPEEEQGRNAFRGQAKPRTSLGKHGRDNESQGTGNGDMSKKRLRRTASTRLESQSQDMWQDISAQSVSRENTEVDQWKDGNDGATTTVSESTVEAANPEKARKSMDGLPSEPSEQTTGLFSGVFAWIQGFDRSKTALLQQYLQRNGASVVESASELEEASRQPLFKDRYLVVPHARTDKATNLPELPASTIVTTEWWVERCIHYKRLLDPAEDFLSSPLGGIGHSGFSNLLISTTGFVGVDLRQIAEVVKLMGATYQEKIVPASSVLISASSSIKKEKAYYANRHRIPVVKPTWLWSSLKERKKLPFDDYILPLPAVDPKDFDGESSATNPASSEMLSSRNKERVNP